jgi:Immunoglobulin I-set domain.
MIDYFVLFAVPPDILDYPTSSDIMVREGSNVSMRCAASGSPPPSIMWRREGGEMITNSFNNTGKLPTFIYFVFHLFIKLNMYLCGKINLPIPSYLLNNKAMTLPLFLSLSPSLSLSLSFSFFFFSFRSFLSLFRERLSYFCFCKRDNGDGRKTPKNAIS